VTAAAQEGYPVRYDGAEDQRLSTRCVGEVAAVLEMHGFPPVHRHLAVMRLRSALAGFVYGENTATVAAELETRINAAASATYTPAGKLSSEDCCASAHELRRLKGANGALVIVRDAEGHYHMGSAVDEGSRFESVSDHLMAELERYLGPKTSVVRNHVFSVDESGGVS